MDKKNLFFTKFKKWDTSIRDILDAANFADLLKGHSIVLLKPNLVEPSKPPITTPVELVAAIIAYIKTKSPAVEIIIGEGSGSIEYETMHVFKTLKFNELAEKEGVTLIDLNESPTVHLKKKSCRRWPEMHLPEITLNSFLVLCKAKNFA